MNQSSNIELAPNDESSIYPAQSSQGSQVQAPTQEFADIWTDDISELNVYRCMSWMVHRINQLSTFFNGLLPNGFPNGPKETGATLGSSLSQLERMMATVKKKS